MQLEQEYEEKQMVLHEKQDLEGLIGTLCEQVEIGNDSGGSLLFKRNNRFSYYVVYQQVVEHRGWHY